MGNKKGMRAIKVREEREADQMQGLVGLVRCFFVMGNGKHSELHAKHHLKCNTDACCCPSFVCDL